VTNESAVLGLLADLYRQIHALQTENTQLRDRAATLQAALDRAAAM